LLVIKSQEVKSEATTESENEVEISFDLSIEEQEKLFSFE